MQKTFLLCLADTVSFICSFLKRRGGKRRIPKKNQKQKKQVEVEEGLICTDTTPTNTTTTTELLPTWLLTSKAALHLRGAAKDFTAARLRPACGGSHLVRRQWWIPTGGT